MSNLKQNITDKLEWIESLDSSPETHRNNIIQFNQEVELLIEMGDRAVSPLIEKLFKSKNRYVLWAAAWALREIGNKRALDAFWYASKKYQSDIGLQRDFILGICTFQDRKISKALIELLKKRNNSLASVAIRGIGLLKESRAVPFLVDLFLNGTQEEYALVIPGESKLPGVHVKKMIIETLGEIQTNKSMNELNTILYIDSKKFLESQHFDRLKCDVIVALSRYNNRLAKEMVTKASDHPIKGVKRIAKKYLLNWNS